MESILLEALRTSSIDFNIDSEYVKVAHSLLELQGYMEDENENFVIGGAVIYNLLLPYANKVYVAQLDKDFEGTELFPILKNDWKEVSREKGIEEKIDDFGFEYITYERK